MSTLDWSLQQATKTTAQIAAATTIIPLTGQIVWNTDTGKYCIGDGTTTLNNLVFYGGISASGLTVGTTTITGGTSTRVLYNNAGVVGEYAVTGTGSVVLNTSPTFTTSAKVNGILNIYDTTQTINGGIVSQINGAVLSIGANNGSSNIFGGTYDSTQFGGVMQIDTRSTNNDIFVWQIRQTGSTASGGSTLMKLNNSGILTVSGSATSAIDCRTTSTAQSLYTGYYDTNKQAFRLYGDTSNGGILSLYSTTGGEAIRICAQAAGLVTYFNGSRVAIGQTTSAARLEIAAGTASANTAPLKLGSGTNLTTAVSGVIEYNNTFHFTNSDATRRHLVLAPNTTKVVAAAPYANDGYIVVNIGGTDFKLMTTA